MKFKKLLVSSVVMGMMASSLVGCSSSGGGDDKIKVGLSMNTLNNPFFVAVSEGAKKGAKDLGVEIVVTDAQNQPSKQQTDIENLLAQQIDILIVDPADSDAIVSGIEAANEQEIPVITIDRAATGGEVVSHIGFDAIKSGNIAGQYIVDQIKGKGNIVELQGILGTNVAQDRSKGFNEIISKNKDIKVVAKQSANFDRAEAMSVMENILQANKEIDAVYAANDEMVLGALEAIEAAGRLDDIIVIGCDAIDPAIEAIKSGKLEATIAEPPFFLGKSAVEVAIKALNKETVEKQVILGSELTTKENVDTIKTKE
jgi:ribose transport system substrate-binding protein